ncbi:hypothetical protein OKW23_001499 [Bacilli bacterium PM5-9]|nr:hypothetical protein [Bacilli bacterium PM5-9]
MKIKKLFFPLILLSLVACSNSNVNKIETINVENISVQELDDDEYIKEQDKKGDKTIAKKYKMENDNFSIIEDSAFNGCTDLRNNRLENFAIRNSEVKVTIDKKRAKYVIYQMGEKNTCKKTLTIKDKITYKAAEHNGALYIETKDAKDDNAKRSLYKYDGKKLKLIQDGINPVNNMVSVNGKLFVSYGLKLDVVSNDDKLINLKKKSKSQVWSISGDKTHLNILFRNKKTEEFNVNRYTFEKDKEIKNIEDMNQISTKILKFENSDSRKAIDKNVSASNDKYVVHSEKMICKIDYSSCKTTIIDGETIENVVKDFIIYNSDRSYISYYLSNKKQVLSSLEIKYANLDKKELLLKIYKNDENEHEYFKYETKREY